MIKTVENEDLASISKEVSQAFGLNFVGAERSDGKWTIKFTSQKMSEDEDSMNHDNLDDVYGVPSAKGKKPGKGKMALTFDGMSKFAINQEEVGFTTQEMFEARNSVSKLLPGVRT